MPSKLSLFNFVTKMNSFASSQPNGRKIVCISDTHSRERQMTATGLPVTVPPGDILVHAGDFSNVGLERDITSFVSFLKEQPHAVKIVIAGNHDITMQPDYYVSMGAQMFHKASLKEGFDKQAYADKCRAHLTDPALRALGIHYLQDEGVTITAPLPDGTSQSLNVYGSPWQPEFYDWAFNLPRGAALDEKWAKIPAGTDLLVTHGPPHGILDKAEDGYLCGCEDLRRHVFGRVRPRVHVFGHIHEGYGTEHIENMTFVNACTCNLRYRPYNPPIELFLPFDRNLPAVVLNPAAVAAAVP